ncbi:hypothetical protein BDI4_380042 [Burkholderia diffusa]|nr:hypothetical protein BDI4_380042 [Burkholderia diffusa]
MHAAASNAPEIPELFSIRSGGRVGHVTPTAALMAPGELPRRFRSAT